MNERRPTNGGARLRYLAMVAGTRAVTSWMSIDAFQRTIGPKELQWVDGASHNDLYDKPQYVDPTVEKLASFSRKPSAPNQSRQEPPRSLAPSLLEVPQGPGCHIARALRSPAFATARYLALPLRQSRNAR